MEEVVEVEDVEAEGVMSMDEGGVGSGRGVERRRNTTG